MTAAPMTGPQGGTASPLPTGPARPARALPYRRDIDGLRALAVVLVVAYHLGIAPLSGGYVGVDLFFVISGYLIASIFAREAELTPRVLANFFKRRIQRLLPAFVVVALVTSLVGSVFLLPEDLTEFVKSLRESFLLRSNVYFSRATEGYFAADASTLPWLHTWTLSVEWHFYVAFAGLVWFLRKLRLPGRARAALAILAAGALYASMWLTAHRPGIAYLATGARAFEFLFGALAVGLVPRLGRRAALALSLVGVVALCIAATTLDRHSSYPGLPAALVCILGVTLLVVGQRASILASDWAAFIGKRSYSIYLWHWPPLALLAYVQVELSGLEKLAFAVALLIVADATYRFVERPLVAARWSVPAVLGVWWVLPTIVAVGAYPLTERHGGFVDRFGPDTQRVYASLRAFDTSQADRCHGFRGADIEACAFGDVAGRRSALLIGDSHARAFTGFVEVLARAAHVKAYGVTDAQCLAVVGVDLPDAFQSAASCRLAVERNSRLMHERRFDFVVIGQRWAMYPATQLAKLDATVAAIVASGAVPVLFRPLPEDGQNKKDCFFRNVKLHDERTAACAIDAQAGHAGAEQRAVEAMLDALHSRYPSVRLIDLRAVQCDAATCATGIDGTPLYSDTNHLTPFGADALARRYLARLANPLVP